jgi:general secretion pathway protein A
VEIFSAAALREVYRLSSGIPRIINVMCDRALLGAFTQEIHHVGASLVRTAAGEVYGRPFSPPWIKALAGVSAIAAVTVLGLGIWQLTRHERVEVAVKPIAAALPAVAAPPPQPVAAVVQQAPVSKTESERDIGELLKTRADETNTETAFAQLFGLWGGTFDPAKGRPCDQALSQGLQCVYQQGSWGQLRTLNRPAILTLIDDAGNAHQVVVAGLDEGSATVGLRNEQQPVSVASISRYWYGDYLVLWRPQVASQSALSAGMQGDGVRWLRDSLNTVQGRSPKGATSDYYDEELVRMVEDFQRQHRLNVDGIAGIQTQIVLDTLNNPAGAPLLLAQGG